MSARLFLALRWVAVGVLILAIVLIIARWKLPMRERRSQSMLAYLRDLWHRLRERREDIREEDEDLRVLRGRTALVVDPDERSLRVMAWKLDGLKARVMKARTGSQALEMARKRRPDLVIADSMLPDISAAAFFREVEGWNVPLVFVGVTRGQWDELRSLGRNVVCLAKPYDPEEAAMLAGEMLRRES